MPDAPFVIPDQPHHAVRADQWYEDGYVLWDGRVYAYFISRKEQYDELGREWTREAFLADPGVPEEARAWLRSVPG